MTAAYNLRLGSPILLPGSSSPSFTNTVIDASTKGVAWIVQIETTTPITGVLVRYGSRTGTPPTYKASIQSVTTTAGGGVPSGTILGGGSPASVTFTPPADTSIDGLVQEYTFTNALSGLAIGDVVAFCIEYDSGTVNSSNCSSFTTNVDQLGLMVRPYSATKSTTWSKWQPTGWRAMCGYKASSEVYGLPIQSFWGTDTGNVAGRRQAAFFTLPGSATTYKIRKMTLFGTLTGDNNLSFLVKIWNQAGTVLQSLTVDTDQIGSPNGAFASLIEIVWPDSLGTLTAGVGYYIGLEVATTASSTGVCLRSMVFRSSADANALSDGGNLIFASYDGSTWTTDGAKKPFIELQLESVTESSGGGAVIINKITNNYEA